ncbi:MAG TPA: DUF2817 domain-containing protein, partial [Kiloniellales bacterium]|nr:DUF2817 domain-containing protein [Kiloniellales bacterium]
MSAAAFARDYGEARAKFRAASESAGGRLESFTHPLSGPDGVPLGVDVARHGPERAEKLLVTISGTHGVEGFCGSGVQVAWLGERQALPPGIALLQIHAINPHGFAWLRRVTEENIDLNRNFADFARPPENAHYDAIHAKLCPSTWDDSTPDAINRALDAHQEAHGGLQAIYLGQYSHADGLFYGGRSPTWSHRLLKDLFARHAAGARLAVVLDYHSGLGPRGHGVRFCDNPPGSAGWLLVEQWLGRDLISSYSDPSLAPVLHGIMHEGLTQVAGDTLVLTLSLEFGTLPLRDVGIALAADNWLHQ